MAEVNRRYISGPDPRLYNWLEDCPESRYHKKWLKEYNRIESLGTDFLPPYDPPKDRSGLQWFIGTLIVLSVLMSAPWWGPTVSRMIVAGCTHLVTR